LERKLEKLNKIIGELKTKFYERDEIIEGAVCPYL